MEHQDGRLGTFGDDDFDPPRGGARPVIAAWAAGWAGTVVVALAWLVSLSFADSGEESPFSWILSYAVFVMIYTTVPALVGLVVLSGIALMTGPPRAVPDWGVIGVATVVGVVAGPLLGLSVEAGAVPALIGSMVGIALLRIRSALLRWAVAAVTLALVLVIGRYVPIV